MKRIAFVPVVVALLGGLVAALPPASGQSGDEAAPLFGIKMPAGYREWKLIAVAREDGTLNDLRAILGNDIAFKAAREGTLPYPDGSIIVRIAWTPEPLAESEKAFGRAQSFVSGAPRNGVQFMVRDQAKYAATGGWGYAQFDDGHLNGGKPASEAVHNACFACHTIAKDRDFVFNRYAP